MPLLKERAGLVPHLVRGEASSPDIEIILPEPAVKTVIGAVVGYVERGEYDQPVSVYLLFYLPRRVKKLPELLRAGKV